MRVFKQNYFIGLCCIGLISLLLAQRISLAAPSPMRWLSSPLPTPNPRPTIYGWSGPPPAPTNDPASTPSQFSSFSTIPYSPLPTPTPIPDFVPPHTALHINGVPPSTQWYHTPVSVTFVITDNFFAGVTEYRLGTDPTWTYHEYYYPPVTIQDEGIHTLTYRSIDIVRNVETPQTTPIRIDQTAPQTDAPVVNGNQLRNGWYNTPVQVTLRGSDALSGLAGFAQETANAVWVASPAVTTLATTGQHTLIWRAVDNAGNVSPAQQTTVQVDLTPPTTTATLDALPVNGWYTRPVTVTLNAVDEGAGVFQTQYRVNQAASWQGYGAPFRLDAVGVQTVVYHSTDRALNTEASHTLTVPLDLAAPLLQVSTDPPTSPNGWYRTGVVVTAQATDAQSGVAAVAYALDGASWQAYSAPVLIAPGTAHTVQFRAQDHAGHIALSPPLMLGVDAQPPTTTLFLNPTPNAAGWLNQPVTLTLIATDTETGVFQTQYQWLKQPSPAIYQQPLHLSQEGQTTLTWFSVDRALKQEAPHTQLLKVDLTPPTIAYTLTGQSVAPGWYQTAATLHVTATDALAGVAQVEITVDGGGWQPYTAPLTVASGGQHTVQLRARDQAGNFSAMTPVHFGIDTLAPQTTVWLAGGQAPNGWYVTPVTVTLTTTDTGAGVANVQWRLNGGAWQPYTGPFVVTRERVNLLEYYAVDKAGNQAAQQYIVFSLDLQNPASQVVVVHGVSGRNGWYVSPVSLTFNGQDLESGLSSVAYQLDAQIWQTATGALEFYTEGIHHVTYRALDASGRVEATHTLTVALDFSPPAIQTHFPVSITYGDLNLTNLYTATDNVSQVLTTTLLLNGQPYQPAQSLSLGENRIEISAANGAGLTTQRRLRVIVTGDRLYLPIINAR
ncbi:MAG: hypothetical protein U0350_42775 [Caldilineaceae bacterium]